jgi:hypothetical protein
LQRNAIEEETVSSLNLVRWGGVAAMVGGALFAVLALVMASMPRGCIGAECAFREGRDTGLAGGALLMLALLLVVAGAAGLVIRTQHAGRFGRLGVTSVVVGAVAAMLLFIGTVLNTQNSSLVPLFIIPGLLALIVGFVLLSVAVLRAGVLPRWAAIVLVVGSLAMLGFNDQNWQALMAVPNGFAWMAVGYVLWADREGVTRQAVRAR